MTAAEIADRIVTEALADWIYGREQSTRGFQWLLNARCGASTLDEMVAAEARYFAAVKAAGGDR